MDELRLEVPPPAELTVDDLGKLAVLPDGVGAGVPVGFWNALTDWANPDGANFARCVTSPDLTVVSGLWNTMPHVVELDDEGEPQLTQLTELPQDLQVRAVTLTASAAPMDAVKTSHFYPLFTVLGDAQEVMLAFAAKVRMLPLGIGLMDRTVGLVLTSTGANYVLALAEAYVRLGYLPPHEFAFIGIPGIRTENERIAQLAIMRSAYVHASRLRNRMKSFAHVDLSTAEHEAITR